VFAIGCWPVGAAVIGAVVALGVTTVVLRAPPTLGLAVLPLFMLAAPGGALFAGCGALEAEFGEGGDCVEPLWAKTGLDSSRTAKAGMNLFMSCFLQSSILPSSTPVPTIGLMMVAFGQN